MTYEEMKAEDDGTKTALDAFMEFIARAGEDANVEVRRGRYGDLVVWRTLGRARAPLELRFCDGRLESVRDD